MVANFSDSMESKNIKTSIYTIILFIFLYYLFSCRTEMVTRGIEIDQSILDEEDEDDTTITGQESISFFLGRA